LESATQSFQRPRFRNDLVAQQLEEEGIQYVDVTDPNSGSTFRFYDVEYSIACGMNGERDLPALVEWARADLGIDTTADELATVMSTLAELGYLESGDGFELGPSGGGAAITDEHAPELELGAPGGIPDLAAAAEGTPAPELELGPPGVGERDDVHVKRTVPVQALELGVPAAPQNGAGSGAVELGAEDLEDYHSAVTEMPRAPTASPPPPPGTEDDMSFAGLMDSDALPTAKKLEKVGAAPSPGSAAQARAPFPSSDSTPTPPPPIEITAEAPPEMRRHATVKLDGDEPTNLPGPMQEPDDDEDVSVDLSAHISLDKREVEEAVRASRVMNVPEIPADLLKEAPADIRDDKPAMPLPPPPSTSQQPAIVADDILRQAALASTATPLPERPTTAVSSKPIDPTRVPAGATAAKKGGSGGLIAFLIVLVVAGGGAIYWFAIRPGQEETKAITDKPVTPVEPLGVGTPPPVPPTAPVATRPTATLAERTGQVVDAPIKGAGRVAWLAAEGKDVAAGEPIAKLQGFQRWEQQRTNALGRLDFYQGELDKSKAANNAAAVDKNEKKVQEKKDLIKQAEDELAKLVATAPSAGKVQLVAKPGAMVAPGDVVAKLSGGGPQLTGSFDAGDQAATFSAAGAACQVAAKGAPDRRSACVIESVEGAKVNVRVLDGSPFKAGDEVELQSPK
jgi:hypothetical protein